MISTIFMANEAPGQIDQEKTALLNIREESATAKELSEVVNVLGSGNESFLKEVMEAAAKLYEEWESDRSSLQKKYKKKAKALDEIDEKWANTRTELEAENTQIWRREIVDPYLEHSTLLPKIGDLRWKLLTKLFYPPDDSLIETINSIPEQNRTVKSVLRAYFKLNDCNAAKTFFNTYTFDTSLLDSDLIEFLKRFVKYENVNFVEFKEGTENVGDHYGYQLRLTLKQNQNYELSEFLTRLPQRHLDEFGSRGIDDGQTASFRERAGSDAWINNLINFLLVDRVNPREGGDRKIENKDELLCMLVRFAEFSSFIARYDHEKLEYQSTRTTRNAEVVVHPDEIEEHLRKSDKLKMLFPNLSYVKDGRSPKGNLIPVEGEPPRSYFFQKNSAKYPDHVAAEFSKVTFRKWSEGDLKGIITPISRNLDLISTWDGTYAYFDELTALRKKQESAFVKHLPTFSGVMHFTASAKARLATLEKEYGAKPDEYAEKLYDLYGLAIYFHKLGEVLYDKGATEAQKKAGLEKMFFAAGLTRVLERMLAMLEVRLAVMEVSRTTEIPEFLRFAEAIETLAKDPLSRQVEKVIDDNMMKLRAAIETTKAE